MVVLEDLDRSLLGAPLARVDRVVDILEALGAAALSALNDGTVQCVLDRNATLRIRMHHTKDELLDGWWANVAHEDATLGEARLFCGRAVRVFRHPVVPALHEFLVVLVLLIGDRPEVAGEGKAHPEDAARPNVELGGVIRDCMLLSAS